MTSRSSERKLTSNLPAATLLAKAETFLLGIQADLASFTAQDPDIDAGFVSNFTNDIAAAHATKSPEEIKGELMLATEDVKAKLAEACDSVQEVYFYLKKAFPGQPGKLVSYGQQEYVQARSSAGRMVMLMDNADHYFTADSAELTAAGFTVAKKTAFLALRDALKDANAAQGDLMGKRLDFSDDYYEKLNWVWEKMVQIHNAAVIIYKDYYPGYRKFLLYDPDSAQLAFTLTVPVGNVPVYHRFQDSFATDQPFEFHMTVGASEATICFAMAKDQNCQGTPKTLAAGETATFTYADFGGVGQYLRIVQNGPMEMKVRVTVAV